MLVLLVGYYMSRLLQKTTEKVGGGALWTEYNVKKKELPGNLEVNGATNNKQTLDFLLSLTSRLTSTPHSLRKKCEPGTIKNVCEH